MNRIKALWANIKQRISKWLKTEDGRSRSDLSSVPQQEAEKVATEEPLPEYFIPETLADLLWLLKKTPKSVLSDEEREIIVTAMTFDERKVREVMLPKAKMTFVHENDFLGPLTLDKLYKSGLSHFPVKNSNGEIIGVLHTESLNSLEIKDTDRAKKYLDDQIYYMRDDYTLDQAMAAFLRTNCYFFVVINRHGEVVGMMSFEELLKLLLGKLPRDSFTGDAERSTVANR